ncbi:MAG: hypothetical protein J5J00_00775 [Deltaproteobacteria bacterium]|nr:hypothetical protein [Deltaproteobacteria bacterium]
MVAFTEEIQSTPQSGAHSSLNALLSDHPAREIPRLVEALGLAPYYLHHEDGIYMFQAKDISHLPKLPADYAFKGGAAREALKALLFPGHKSYPARDLDVIRFGDKPSELDQKIAAQLMDEDSLHGHGVELVKSFRSYFSSRDLTVNQILLDNGVIVCTEGALFDLAAGIVRPAKNEIRKNGWIKGKIFMKVLRLAAEEEALGHEVQIEDLPASPDVHPFHIALHLERALQRGEDVALKYLQKAEEFGIISSRCKSRDDLAAFVKELSGKIGEGLEFFKSLPYAIKQKIADDLETPSGSRDWRDIYDRHVFNDAE